MTIESRNRAGTLTIDDQPWQVQTSAVKLSPSIDTVGDRLELLSTDVLEPEEKVSWTMDVSTVQDFEDPDGITEYCRAFAGDVVPYVWAPRGALGPSYGGTLKVRPVGIGGDVNVRLVESVSFPVLSGPTPTYPAP